MATPQPMKRLPSQQAGATPGASTPFSSQLHAFSPHGPRSSPQQFKKSPANGSNNHGSAVNFDSPSAAAFGAALGIGGYDPGMDNMGMGQLGGLRRNDDEEREKRLQTMINILKVCRSPRYMPCAKHELTTRQEKKGIVSEEGLERLTKETGLDHVWDEGMGAGVKTRTLVIAGRALSLDIVMLDHIVQSVSLAFPESGPFVTQYTPKAEKILLDDLKLLPNQHPLTKKLDDFAANLERLAILDKLSIVPQLVCHDAIAGIYESLVRLHEWELQKLREDPAMSGKGEESLSNVVLCTKSGYPVMHERGRVGLSLDYWREKRLHLPQSPTTRDKLHLKPKTWGLLIGCAPMGEMAFQPDMAGMAARVSNKWISDAVEKVQTAEDEMLSMTIGPILDWQQPESVRLPPADGSKPPDGMTDPILSGLHPEVMFMATFDPPVILPLPLWRQLQTINPPSTSADLFPPTFDGLLFPIAPGSEPGQNASDPRTLTTVQNIPCIGKDGERSSKKHENRLFINKKVYGRTLTETPFMHPQRLVEMLPHLRQYAFLGTLLLKSFDSTATEPWPPQEPSHPSATQVTAITTTTDEFAAFMGLATAEKPKKSEDDPLKVDITLHMHPATKLQVAFPLRDRIANIMLEIKLNGVVHVESQNIIPEDHAGPSMYVDDGMGGNKGKGREMLPQNLGRALEIMEDIGSWCEWIRSRLD